MKELYLILIFVVGLAITALAINDITIANDFTAGTRAVADEVNDNFDSCKNTFNKLVDSLDNKFIRFSDLTDGDSTLTLFTADSIKVGDLKADTIHAAILAGKLTGGSTEIEGSNFDITGGSATGMTTLDADTANIEDLKADSIHDFTLVGKLTAGATEIEGSGFDINGGTIDGTTITTSIMGLDSADIKDLKADTIHATQLVGKLTAGATEIEGSGFDINGGTIDGATIGAASASTGVFTNVTGTSLDVDTISDGAGNDNLLLSTDNFTSPLNKFGFGKTSLEAWYSNKVSIEVGSLGSIVGMSSEAANFFAIGSNWYQDASGNDCRMMNSTVGYMSFLNGVYRWHANAAGTADVAFTPTERMSLSMTKLDVGVDTLSFDGDMIVGDDIFGVDSVDVNDITVDKLIYPQGSEVTLSTNAITITGSNHFIDTQGDAALDTLSTINAVSNGQILILHTIDTNRDVFIDDGAGNINLSADRTLSFIDDVIVLMFISTASLGGWLEISFSDNE